MDDKTASQPRYNTAPNPDLMEHQAQPRVSFTGVTARVLPLKASLNTLQDFCDNYLNFPDDRRDMKASQRDYFKPAVPYVYFQMINYGKMATESENLGWIAQNEILFSIPLEWYRVDAKNNLVFHDWALICPFIFVDNDMSLTTGREAYGWSKVRGWLEWVPTSWTRDPRSPRRLLSMQTEVYPELYVGAEAEARTLLEVTQQQPPSISPSLLTQRDPFNPLWGIPDAVRGSIKLYGDLFETFMNLPILGASRRDADSLSRMSGRALQNLRAIVPWFGASASKAPCASPDGQHIAGAESHKLYFNQVTLKQFRDAAEPEYACYQALVNSKITVDHYYDVGLLGGPNLVVGDLSGGFRLKVHEYDEYPIVKALGLEVEEKQRDEHETPLSLLKPTMPFWLSCDLRYDTGDTLAWRGKHSPTWNTRLDTSRISSGESPPMNPFNNTRGAATQEVAGPFIYPDATVRVFPLLADSDTLLRFCDDYLNRLEEGDATGIENSSFEPWGEYVYMIVTSYGDEYGGKSYAERGSIGRLAHREISFCLPVKWMETDGQCTTLKSLAVLTPYMFSDSSRHVISEREINGRDMVHSRISSNDDAWLQESGPVRPRTLATLQTLLLPQLNEGQPAAMRELIEITEKDVESYNEDVPWAVIRAKWEPELLRDLKRKLMQRSAGEEDWEAMLQMFRDVCGGQEAINFLALKQYRGTENVDRACYEALVLLQRNIQSITDMREIHRSLHVRIHQYPTMPIVKTLGLKVKAVDSSGKSVVQHLEPIRPFFMRVSMRDELGTNLFSRINSMKWQTDASGGMQRETIGLTDKQRRLVASISEPKALIEWLLSEKFAARDPAYYEYDPQEPLFMRSNFGMSQNSAILDANSKPQSED
ncbi:MAG: hypothetical protein P8Y01_00350 [Woeseiaceae bacterium]|jgi:hypothetical protein